MCSQATSKDPIPFKGISMLPLLFSPCLCFCVRCFAHGREPTNLCRFHQDVKPSNILVILVSGDGHDASSDYRFVLADLGLSHFKKEVRSQDEMVDRDTSGTRAYGMSLTNTFYHSTLYNTRTGAPECHRPDHTFRALPIGVKSSVDIWSLGCVYSEAACWVVHGKSGLMNYRQQRRIATAQIPEFRDGNCFHDGQRVLEVVDNLPKRLLPDMRRSDHITARVLDMVREMLEESQARPKAAQLSSRRKRMLGDADNKLTERHAPPSTPPNHVDLQFMTTGWASPASMSPGDQGHRWSTGKERPISTEGSPVPQGKIKHRATLPVGQTVPASNPGRPRGTSIGNHHPNELSGLAIALASSGSPTQTNHGHLGSGGHVRTDSPESIANGHGLDGHYPHHLPSNGNLPSSAQYRGPRSSGPISSHGPLPTRVDRSRSYPHRTSTGHNERPPPEWPLSEALDWKKKKKAGDKSAKPPDSTLLNRLNKRDHVGIP